LAGLDLGLVHWLSLVGLGALVGLDGVSWPQTMISRPVVAGALGGLFFGDVTAGFMAGALLEIVSGRHPPYGAARYPETGPAGLVCGAAYAASGSGELLPLLTVTLAGWTIGWMGSYSIHFQRTINTLLMGESDGFVDSPRSLARRHRLAIRLDALRAGVITGALLVPVMLAARLAATFEPPVDGRISAALAAAGIAGLAGAGARVLGGHRRGWPAFAIGAVIGAVLVVVSR
jgi:mannose/fructose/N-acetylgalactosamine-specific phosphotransferase system component IIC